MSSTRARAPSASKVKDIPDAWAMHAPALAAWTVKSLVNRHDAFGRYLGPDQRKPKSTAVTVKGEPTAAVLQRHFQGRDTGDLIGLHSTVRDEPHGEPETAACWSHWLAIDIDRHKEGTDGEKTRAYALLLYGRALRLGFTPLLYEGSDNHRSRVGMWRGGLRLRFHTPLIEPCWRISRTRLSDKDSCGRSREAAPSTLQATQAQSLVEVCVGEP